MSPRSNLQKLRKQVEKLDENLITLLSKRLSFTKEIQKIKKELKMPINQKMREKELIASYLNLAKAKKLPLTPLKRIFRGIFQYSKKSGIINR